MNVQRFGLIRWGGAFTRTGISYWFSAERGGVCVRTKSKVAGGSPAAGYFSCAAKRSNQEKAAPAAPPPGGGTLCYSKSRAAAELALAKSARAQTVLADNPRLFCVARRYRGGASGRDVRRCNVAGHTLHTPAYRYREFPSDSPSNAAESGGVGEHCLSPRIVLAEGELRSRPARRVTQGTPVRGRGSGVPFSLVTFFLGKQKKVTSRRAAPGDLFWPCGGSLR